MELQFANSYN